MSVLIKGMEMPKSCGDCNFYYVDYEEGTATCLATSCYVTPRQYNKGNRDSGCPLGEIHTPHGRLIDADELFCEIDGIKGWDYGDESDMAISAAEALSAIDDSPTVIEAEE